MHQHHGYTRRLDDFSSATASRGKENSINTSEYNLSRTVILQGFSQRKCWIPPPVLILQVRIPCRTHSQYQPCSLMDFIYSFRISTDEPLKSPEACDKGRTAVLQNHPFFTTRPDSSILQYLPAGSIVCLKKYQQKGEWP